MTDYEKDYVFLTWALTESGRAIKAIDEAKRLGSLRDDSTEGIVRLENHKVFDSIRLGLQFSANISKVFWPPRSKRKVMHSARGTRLRSLTGIPEDHPLGARTLRDHIEHFDERLDDWVLRSPKNFVNHEMVLNEEFSPAQKQTILDSTVLVYDAATHAVYILGQVFSLSKLREDVVDAQRYVSKALSTLGC